MKIKTTVTPDLWWYFQSGGGIFKQHLELRCHPLTRRGSVHTGGGSWRRAGDDKREERKEERPTPPRPREGEREEDGEKSSWRSEKDKENAGRSNKTTDETDDDGWTTVARR